MKSKKWSQEEDQKLKDNYQLTKIEIAKLFPDRTIQAVYIRASWLGLKKERNEHVHGKLDILLEESHQSYYWIGFILADGCFIKNRLRISLSIKDESHLKQFAQYINSNCYYSVKPTGNIISLSSQDKFIVPKIKEKFDFKPRKTYNPPTKIPDDFDLLLSLFIGYIDGDGSIRHQTKRKDCVISIQVHSSWLNWLMLICNKLQNTLNINLPKPKINKRGYASWIISNNKILLFLKKHCIKHNLIILNRKWDKINLNQIFRYDTAKENKINILKFRDNGFSNKQIAELLNVSKGYVSRILKRYKTWTQVQERSLCPL